MNTTTDTQKEALQNFADTLGLIVHEHFTQDKRKSVKKYFATYNGTSVSPPLRFKGYVLRPT